LLIREFHSFSGTLLQIYLWSQVHHRAYIFQTEFIVHTYANHYCRFAILKYSDSASFLFDLHGFRFHRC
jgi:hypothetical protein